MLIFLKGEANFNKFIPCTSNQGLMKFISLLVVLCTLKFVYLQTVPSVDFGVELGQPTTPFSHVLNQCVGSGHALLALRADYRAYLTRVKHDIGFTYVRFHGVLDDDMSTYTTVNGEAQTSFFNVDSIYDFLLSINMKPLIEVSFMPELLASGNQTVFHYNANITPPSSYPAWVQVKKTIYFLLKHKINIFLGN